MTDYKNRRQFQRIAFPSYLSLTVSDNTNGVYQGLLQDISLKGALVTLENAPESLVGKTAELSIVPEQAEFSLRFTVDIRHRLPLEQGKNPSYGLQITQMSIETASHLRRLIELNLADNASLQRELSQLITI